jgi:D-3-phosphoglycerate dehydrogenase
MINADTLASMKDGIRILNFARGELVDSKAIIDALASGKAAAYVTDFPNDEQLCVDGITAIPHLGASTPESEENCAMMAAEEVALYLEKGIIKNSVNLPNAALPEAFECRTCFIHKEDEAFGTKVSAEAIAQGAAIKNLFSASKKGMGYTVIDTDKALDTAKIDGAIRIRTI